MANQIRIKRRSSSGSTGAPAALKNGELAFNEADNTLYYGYGDDGSGNATSIPAIGGSSNSTYLDGAFVTLDTTQDIDSAKTILTGNTWTYNSGSTLNVAGTFQLGGTTVTADATELNYLDGITGVGISQNNIFKADTGIVDNDFLRVNGTVIEGRSAGEVAADIGAITTLGGAEGIDVTGTGQSRSITLDLTELPDMTAAVTRTEDELIILDNGDQSRKLISEIDLSDFNDDVTTIYDVSAASVANGSSIVLTGTGVDTTPSAVEIVGGTNVTVTHNSATKMTISSTDYNASTPLVESSNTFTLDTPTGIANVFTGFTDSTNDSILYFDNTTSAWVTMSIDDLQSEIDTNTTYSNGTGLDLTGTTFSLKKATTTERGGVELFSGTVQSVAANTVSTTAGRTYGLQLNSADQGVVNVPWTDTTYVASTNGGLAESNEQFSISFGNLPDMSASAVTTSDQLIIDDGGTVKRKNLGTIDISKFKTDVATEITSVGTLTGLAVAGSVTISGANNDLNIVNGDVVISSGVLQGPSTFYIDPAPFDSPQANNSPAATGTVVIRGDLQVDGTTTTINSTEISITDKNMVLADDQTALSGIDGAGLLLGDDGATGGLVELVYNSSSAALTLDTSFAGTGASPTQSLDNWIIDGGTF